jgi:two-component system chemotaxis sensor kinase CheA
LDQGLEPEHERLHAGKPARGSIHIHLTRTHHGVSIHLQDDGRGLNVNRIQDKAQSLGILTSTSALNTEDLAELIFEHGLSSRAQENQVSGRGMGLSAVRSLAKDLGGTIRLELNQKDRTAPALSFVIDLPADAVTELNDNAVQLQKA